MLQFIRSQAGSFYVKLLFVLLIGSFGLWGVGDFLRQTPAAATLITVGSESFAGDRVQSEFRRNMARLSRMLGGGLDADQARAFGLADRTVDGIVANALLDQEATRLHVVVGDKQVTAAIASIPQLKGPDGRIDRAVLINVLRQQGITEQQFIANERDDLRRGSIAAVAGETPIAPAALVDTLYDIRFEHRVADYVVLPTSGTNDVPAPDDAALHSFYDQHHDSYTAPEYRGFTALTLQTSDVAASVQIAEDKIKAAYQDRVGDAAHPGDFVKPETRHILQMLLPDEATADSAEQALTAGTDFAEVAKTIAKQDASTVDLGSVAKADLPVELAGDAFDAKADEVTKPLHSALGWSVLKILDVKPGEVKSYDEAKPQIETELRDDAERDAIDKMANDVQNALSGGAELSAIADQFKLKPVTVAAIDESGRDPAGTMLTTLTIPLPPIIKSIFELSSGQTSNLEDSDKSGGAYYVVKVDSVTAPALRPFDSVKDKVAADWLAEQRTLKVAAEAKELAALVKPDMTLAQLAAARNLKLETTKPFTRTNDAHDTNLPSDAIAGLFKADIGGVAIGVAADGQIVAQLKEIQPTLPSTDTAGLAKLKKQLDQEMGQEMLEQFQLALHDRYAVDVNHAAIDQLLGGGTGQ